MSFFTNANHVANFNNVILILRRHAQRAATQFQWVSSQYSHQKLMTVPAGTQAALPVATATSTWLTSLIVNTKEMTCTVNATTPRR